MRCLVIGSGSIGRRHIQNLMSLGHQVLAVDMNSSNLKLAAEMGAMPFETIDEALRRNPFAAFICTFSNQHITPALKCAQAGCHLFIEKPLSLTLEGIDELLSVAKEKSLIAMVGCNMRFHPSIKRVSEIINNDNRFEKLLLGDIEFGYYLPYAKPDYEGHYMARKELGGNIIFDVIHELDYAVWFFGKPKKVFCKKGILSGLNIDTQDFAELIVEFESGSICSIRLDYLQPVYTRRCKLTGSKACVLWDHSLGKIGITDKDKHVWSWELSEYEISYNKMYLDEVSYFIDCISSSKKPMNSIQEALITTKLAIAANISSEKGCWTNV